MRRLRAFLLALTVAAGLCGCGRKPLQDNGKLRVVCTLFPYYDFVRQIGGDDVDVTLVVPAGRETHSFEPTPLDVIRISEADVFVYNGGESEQWVENILDAAGENIPYVLSMMGAAELHEEEFSEGMQGQGANAHEHSDHDHGHGENGGGDDAEDEETEYDEHIWTSPVNAMALCRAICDALCEADPDNADGYRTRLADYLDELQALDETFRDITDHAARRLVVFGDRFPLLYFCREYDLDYRAAFHGCAGDTEPSLATLKYLIDVVEEQEIPVVYTIELSSRKVAQAIAETTGAQVRTFHSCQTVSRAEFDGGATYISLMTPNAAALKEGLS